jgi:hypothetical protein
MIAFLILLVASRPGDNVVVNGDFSEWPTYTGAGLTTTTVGVDWYGGPGVGATATYDVVPFPAGQTAVPGNPKQHLRITWHTPPTAGEEQHGAAVRGTFLEYFGLQDVRLFSGQIVRLSFYARLLSENPEATLPIRPTR